MNKVLASLSLTMIVVGGIGMVATRAAHGQQACQSGQVCLYDGAGYSGMIGFASTSTPYVGDTANDRASSVINATSGPVALHSDPNFGGFSVCLDSNTGYDNLSLVGLDDNISSLSIGNC